MRPITLDDVKRAVRLSDFDVSAAQGVMSPHPRGVKTEPDTNPPREAGVLALIITKPDGLHVVLTRRTDTLRGHSGQISFPGGRRDPDDASFTATALRETCEEIGICDDSIEILGTLSPFYIPPSNFNVYPSVGAVDYDPVFFPNEYEVAEVFTFPLRDLLDPTFKHDEFRTFNGFRFKAPYYLVNGHKVWGATAVMLSELEHRLHAIIRQI